MKALLICPADRSAVATLAENHPLATVPLLGRTLVEYWVEALLARGAHHLLVLASDRPNRVRDLLGDGARWGLRIDVLPQARELTPEEARRKYRTGDPAEWLPHDDCTVMEFLPGAPELPLFESYAGWFAAVRAHLPRALSPGRIGVHEVQPGIWVGLHAQVSAGAQLRAPCWIGEHVLVSAEAVLGPGAIIEDRAVIERGARVAESVIAPETFVGEHISLHQSLAQGATVVNWQSGSCLRVPDAFLLCSLGERRFATQGSNPVARGLALAAMLVTAPLAVAVMGWSLLRGESALQIRLGVRPQRNVRSAALQTFAYYELTGGSNWLKRWPQFWSVVCGDLTWVGNRPLRPTQALELANDFERLWLTAPVGLVSLADAHGCTEGVSDAICAHASYYAVNANRRLDWFVLSRALIRAAAAIPVRRRARRSGAAVPLPHLVPKQEG